MNVRRFDIGEDLPANLAQAIWTWEAAREPGGLPDARALSPMRLPAPGPRASFLLAPDPACEGGYTAHMIGADCPPEFKHARLAPGDAMADAAFEAWLTRTPMTLAGPGWRAIVVALAHGTGHRALGFVVALPAPMRAAA